MVHDDFEIFCLDKGDSLISTTSRTDIFFVYSASEYKISESIEYISKKMSEKEKCRIRFIEIPSPTSLQHTVIVSSPGYAIMEFYDMLAVEQGRRLLKQTAYISFDKSKVTKAEECILDLIALNR